MTAIDPNDLSALADWFVEQMRKPRDLDAEARVAAFEEQKEALLHVWHVRRGNAPPTAHTREEMEYAASLEPCPTCGHRGLAETQLTGSGRRWTLTASCPSCSTPRTFTYETEDDLAKARPHDVDELSHLPSYLIPVESFYAELQRLLPLVRTDQAARHRALVTMNELVKLTDPHLREQRRKELQALVARAS